MKNKKLVSTLPAVIMLCTICFTVMGAAVPANDAGARAAGFTDVPAGQYYSDAVAWAEDNNIISGYGNRRFGPTDPITREQLVTILWRYEGSPRVSAADFADENRISTYASSAVDWARTNNIVTARERMCGRNRKENILCANRKAKNIRSRYFMVGNDQLIGSLFQSGKQIFGVSSFRSQRHPTETLCQFREMFQ